jgi:hypothetical protein
MICFENRRRLFSISSKFSDEKLGQMLISKSPRMLLRFSSRSRICWGVPQAGFDVGLERLLEAHRLHHLRALGVRP